MKGLALFLEAMANSTYRVAITTTSVVFFWAFIWWSLGFAPAFGSGFARADDLQSVQATLLENAIIEARKQYCLAPNGTEAKIFYLKTVNRRVTDYRNLTDSNYPLPRCEELVFASD